MEKFVITYASVVDTSLYVECVGIYNTIEEARSVLAKDFQSVMEEDYGNHDPKNLTIRQAENEFVIDDNAYSCVTEKIERKII